MHMWRCFCALALFVPHVLATNIEERYEETLSLRTLQDSRVLATFNFTTTVHSLHSNFNFSSTAHDHPQHFRLFPLSLAQLLRRYSVGELHISLSAGKWDYSTWGMPDVDSVTGGAEIRAWLAEFGDKNAFVRWKGLSNALAGIFCASIGNVAERRTVTPKFAFNPEGSLTKEDYRLYYASLPSESVCTENLTPFLKMLPCKSRSGIAMLLNPHRVFDADWHGMSINVISTGRDTLGLTLTFSAVFDPLRLEFQHIVRDWSFRSMFDRTITRRCAVSSASLINVHVPFGDAYSISPPTGWYTHENSIILDLNTDQNSIDVSMRFQDPEARYGKLVTVQSLDSTYPPIGKSEVLPVSIHRVVQGGQSGGKLVIGVQNHQNTTSTIVWTETMPWFIKFYLRSLIIRIGDVVQETGQFFELLGYASSLDHSPSLLESRITLPSMSFLTLSMDLEKAPILYTEHPPDASRGWDLPAAIFTLQDISTCGQRIYGRSLLADLPTPDFSMPYNVIIMTSTLVALFFGSAFNLLTRSFCWLRT